jgi:hypothetical protein
MKFNYVWDGAKGVNNMFIGLGGLPVFRGFFGFIFKPVFSV